MLVRDSGHTVVHTDPVVIANGAAYWTAIRQALIDAGWTEISSNVLMSMRTPQGLQMILSKVSSSGNDLLVRVESPDRRDVSLRNLWMTSRSPSVCDAFRVIANGYQFFTYNNSGYEDVIGPILAGGVPWIPPMLEAPRIVSIDNDDPIEFTVDRDHGMLSGQVAFIDGITSYTGLVGYQSLIVLDDRRLQLKGAIGSGVYDTDTCMVSVPGRAISRLIWAESMQGVTVFGTDKAATLRQTIYGYPNGGWYTDNGYGNQVIMINQFNWSLQNNSSSNGATSGMRIFKRFPAGTKLYGDSYPACEAWICVGESSVMSEAVLVGQLWDAFITLQPNTTERVVNVTYNGCEWKPYTNTTTPSDGCLVIRSGNLGPS